MAYSDGSYRLRLGHHNAADLTTAYDVTSFPIQPDQGNIPWLRPIDPSSVVKESASQVVAFNGTKGAQGQIQLSWYFAPMTPGMQQYLRNTFFAGDEWSADVTLMTWDRSYGWRVLQAVAHWTDPTEVAEPRHLRGYYRVRLDFVRGVPAP